MKWKIIINIPNEKTLTEVLISEAQLQAIEGDIQAKRMIKIAGSYYNTTYIAKIVPDVETTRLEESIQPRIAEKSEGIIHQEGLEKIAELGKKLRDDGVIKG